MKKVLIVLFCFLCISCDSSIQDTTYRVDFKDGTYQYVRGYRAASNKTSCTVYGLKYDSVFNVEEVKCIYPVDTKKD